MISRRLRFEILRRDNHTCRYCGAAAPDVPLAVDHVIPTALGGGDDATNLITACRDCNSGKTSTAPDPALVAEVDATAVLFAKAMKRAADIRALEMSLQDQAIDDFADTWDGWKDADGHTVPKGRNWQSVVSGYLAAGLEPADLQRFIGVAMDAHHVAVDKLWIYFCGICRNELGKRQEIARTLIENGDV